MSSRLLHIAAAEYGVSEYSGTGRISDYHTVNKGETLYRICVNHNVTVENVMKWNSMKDFIVFPGQQLRISDRDGSVSNPRILQYAIESGFMTIRSDAEAWCSIFICWCCAMLGIPHTNSAAARSWLTMGKRVPAIQDADVAVFWRDNPNSDSGHVGIPLSYSEDKKIIYVLGGNQSNMVCVKPYPADRLIAFIRLDKIN